MSKKLLNLTFPLIYLLFIVFVLLTFRDYAVSWDEEFYHDSGKLYLSNFFASPEKISAVIPVSHLLTHGAIVDVLYYLPQKILSQNHNFELLHLTKGLAASFTLIAVYLIITSVITKNKAYAATGAVLLIFFPRWLGDIFDNHMDGTAATLYAFELLFAVKLINSKNLKNFSLWLIALAALSAVSFSHRPFLIILPFIGILMAIITAKFKFKVTTKVIIGILILFIITLYILLNLIDPYVRANGPAAIVQKIGLSENYSVYRGAQLFEGKYIFSKDLPWYYLPKWIVITTPIITLILFALGSFNLLKSLFIKQKEIGIKLSKGLILASFFVPVIIVILTKPVLFDAWRHLLFLSVPLVIIAASGFQFLADSSFRPLRYIAFITVFLSLATTAKAMWELHPYQYLFFNSLTGGLKGAYQKYDTDYWAKTNKEASLWARDHIATNPAKVYKFRACSSKYTSFHYFAKNMVWEKTISQADYFICITKFNGHKAVSDKNTLYIVTRQGTPLNYVKKITRNKQLSL